MSDNITGSQFNNFYNICHLFFTVRKRSCGKVIFLHLSVSLSVHREGGELAWQRRHAWQGQYVWEACVWGACMGACMAGACVAGGMCGRGHVWQGSICARRAYVAGAGGTCMAGTCMVGGHAWQGTRITEGACMAGGRRDGHCSGRYALYWNAFLFTKNTLKVHICFQSEQCFLTREFNLTIIMCRAQIFHVM